eukprot:6226022-Alexandrium_andersonii.AAC.1
MRSSRRWAKATASKRSMICPALTRPRRASGSPPRGSTTCTSSAMARSTRLMSQLGDATIHSA